MEPIVSFDRADGVAVIRMDDGKANVLSPAMLASLSGALDQAGGQDVVVLTGRPGMFSAGFDLSAFQAGGAEAFEMLMDGLTLARRLLSWPTPVVVACNGHAIAMGAFLLLSGDYRVGASGTFKITANEVAIGMILPRTAIEICRQRLTPAAFNRAALLAEVFDPQAAVEAGFIDRVVDPSELAEQSLATAVQLGTLNMSAHAGSKALARQVTLEAIDAALAADRAELRSLFGPG